MTSEPPDSLDYLIASVDALESVLRQVARTLAPHVATCPRTRAGLPCQVCEAYQLAADAGTPAE